MLNCANARNGLGGGGKQAATSSRTMPGNDKKAAVTSQGATRGEVTVCPFSGWPASLSEPPSCPLAGPAVVHSLLAPPGDSIRDRRKRESHRQTREDRQMMEGNSEEEVGTLSTRKGTKGQHAQTGAKERCGRGELAAAARGPAASQYLSKFPKGLNISFQIPRVH